MREDIRTTIYNYQRVRGLLPMYPFIASYFALLLYHTLTMRPPQPFQAIILTVSMLSWPVHKRRANGQAILPTRNAVTDDFFVRATGYYVALSLQYSTMPLTPTPVGNGRTTANTTKTLHRNTTTYNSSKPVPREPYVASNHHNRGNKLPTTTVFSTPIHTRKPNTGNHARSN